MWMTVCYTHVNTLEESVKQYYIYAGQEQKSFSLDYDKLVISVGSYSNTFGIPGVKEFAFFLKDVQDARKIRKRLIECK